MTKWRVNWQTPTWMSGFLTFQVVVDGEERRFAVAGALLQIEENEPAAATLERNIFRIRRALTYGPIWETRNGITFVK